MLKRPLVNNQIRAYQVRVVDEKGAQVGIKTLQEAFLMAQQKGLDLIQVTEKVEPPVCRIMDYGKYLYSLSKKEKAAKPKSGGSVKGIRLGFNISPHDLSIRAKLAEKFLQKGDKVRIELRLRGREKAHQDFAKEKIEKFLELIKEILPIKIERDLKREPRGLTMIIGKGS